MKVSTIKFNNTTVTAIHIDKFVFPIDKINDKFGTDWERDFIELLKSKQFDKLNNWYKDNKKTLIKDRKGIAINANQVEYGPLYRNPHKIWGIGLNYRDHATDLSETAPSSIPASFMKADTTIIGHNDEILLPKQSNKVTGEAELGVIIKTKCKDVSPDNWMDVVAGFTTIIDMTTEDILRQNPRYLTLSKNFDTFFSFGPLLLTADDIKDVLNLRVATVLNGSIHAQNIISNMQFTPDFLVSFHSKVMTLLPGDIISTGTPRAVKLTHGDTIECRITGFPSLINNVRDLKFNK
ncbi:MAG: fumarylacetoacetate hydrolase [Candidatus Lokiarchaeota archaeon]|nr:fumarylacetoacetate hydrolase [Candidatus Lokiarchaeota archaeon]MBD3199674.1 fumarylacetoacetate hydrolase [Candidatus Lokiarchaeota archaeon]